MHSLPDSCLAWSDQALQSTGSMVGLMATSKRIYSKGDLLGLWLSVPLPLKWTLADPGLPGDPPTLKGSLAQRPVGLLLLSWRPLCVQDFVWVFQDWSICSPHFCRSLIIKCHWPSRSDFLGISRSFVGSPDWEAWHVVEKLHRSGRASLVLLFPSSWRTLPHGDGISLYCDCTHPAGSIYSIVQVVVTKTILKKKRCTTKNGCLRRSYK